MNDEPINPPSDDELHDRLIDLALVEVLGGKRPPDLSPRILAASGATTTSVSTPGECAMGGQKASQRSGSRRWIYFAVAASLLVAAAFLLLGIEDPGAEQARRSPKPMPPAAGKP